MTHSTRWNVDVVGDGLMVCEGDHERSAKCEWVKYVRASDVAVLAHANRVQAEELAALRARLTEAERLLRVLAAGLDEHDDGTYSGELRTAICRASAASQPTDRENA